jgi:nucleoside-diphosphate-sugar epimerase
VAEVKVLVTGGAGYIGSMLVRILLDRGYDVICLDRFFFGLDPIKEVADKIKIVKDDIRGFNPVVLDGVYAVFDLAALSNDPSGELDPGKTMDINYRGRVRVANLAKKHDVKKYVLASSCSVYGAQDNLIDERSEINPLTTYAKATYLAEQSVLPLTDEKFSVTVLRQATVYGLSYRMRFDLAVNGMVMNLFKYGKIPIMRDGSQWRPFIHVRDTCKAFISVLEAEDDIIKGEVFNVGSNHQNYQIFNLAKLITESLNIPFVYEWYGSPDKRNYRVDFTKIHKILGFKTEFTPAEGSREVYTALINGVVNPDDLKTITVKWYKHLLEMHKFIKSVELDGVLL